MKTAIEMVERMEALVRRAAEQRGHTGYTDGARAIVAELPPGVDRDILMARHLAAQCAIWLIGDKDIPRNIEIGMWDNAPDGLVKEIATAIRRAREEGNG